MKFILICIQLSLIMCNGCTQDNEKIKENFKSKLFAIRKEKTDASINEDSKLTMIANKIRVAKLSRISKDSIRNLMTYNFIYDYNFEVIELNISDIENISRTSLEEGSEKLKEVLQKNEFNKIGIDIDYNKHKSKVLIISSQNYLSFDKVAYIVPGKPIHPHTPTDRKISIRGEKILEGYYSYAKVKTAKKDNENQLLNELRKPLSFKDNYFFIEEKWDFEDFIFFDSEGNIVSYVPAQ
jgi:hypothetical protein